MVNFNENIVVQCSHKLTKDGLKNFCNSAEFEKLTIFKNVMAEARIGQFGNANFLYIKVHFYFLFEIRIFFLLKDWINIQNNAASPSIIWDETSRN